MRVYNHCRSLKKSRLLPTYQRTIKDGDVIIQKVPVDEFGQPIFSYDILQAYHKVLVKTFPKNKVITTLMDIEVLSKID